MRRVTPKRGKSAQIKAEDEHTLERTRKVREACAEASNAEVRRFNRFRHEKTELGLVIRLPAHNCARVLTIKYHLGMRIRPSASIKPSGGFKYGAESRTVRMAS